MDQKMKNIMALRDFFTGNNIRMSVPRITFQAIVSYSPAGIRDTTNVSVKTDTFCYGGIEFEETDIVNPYSVHTGFNPGFQTYTYNTVDNTLIIKGKAAPSHGGKPYTVTIKI